MLSLGQLLNIGVLCAACAAIAVESGAVAAPDESPRGGEQERNFDLQALELAKSDGNDPLAAEKYTSDVIALVSGNTLRSGEEFYRAATLLTGVGGFRTFRVRYELLVTAAAHGHEQAERELASAWDALMSSLGRPMRFRAPRGEHVSDSIQVEETDRCVQAVFAGSVEARSKAAATSDNAEMQSIVEADQADRKGNWMQLSQEEREAIFARDRERNARTREIVSAGGLHTARDFANASLVMQHSAAFAGYRLAHELAVCSMLLGDRGRGRWLVAATYDRMLRSVGHDQRFGTQLGPAGPVRVDEEGICDAQRVALGCPTLVQVRMRRSNADSGLAAQLLIPGNSIEDKEYGVSLKLPDEVALKGGSRWGEKATTLLLALARRPNVAPSLYYKLHATPLEPPEEGFEVYLRKAADGKAADRVKHSPGYKNREDSFVFYGINGKPALSWTADYIQNGAPHSEYLIRVVSENAVALFFTRGPTAEMDDIRPLIDAAAETLQLP